MSFSQLLATLKARKLAFIIVLTLFVAAAIAMSLILPKRYTSTASVVIDVKSPDPIAGMVLPGMMTPAYMATQLEIIRSDRVAQRVIQALRLGEQAQLRADWEESTGRQGNFMAWLSELLLRNLDVVPSREANVFHISYTAVDPNFAAAMANAFVKAYLDTNVELRVDPAKEYTNLFESQAKILRERIQQAQSRLSAYQKEKGLIATDERLDIENSRLNELSSQLVAIQAMSAESNSRKAQTSSSSAEVLNNPLVASLKGDLSRQEARLNELNARLGAAHPQVVELQANISELRSRIDSEIGRVATSVGIIDKVNSSREAQTRAALEQQRQKVLKLKEQRDEAAAMMRDAEDAQRAYSAVQARFSQTSLESQGNQTNVSMLRAATPPAFHSSPRLTLNTAIAIFLGVNFGIGACVLLEVFDKRLRTAEDIQDRIGMPVMATLPKPPKSMMPSAGKSKKHSLLGMRALPELPGPGR